MPSVGALAALIAVVAEIDDPVSLAPSPDRNEVADGLRRLRNLIERGPEARHAVV